MAALTHPALPTLLAQAGEEFVLAQVHVRRIPSGHELRHTSDRDADPATLQALALDALRALAQHTAQGEFRPLRAAPTLRSGWRVIASNLADLERALNHLYPASIADWAAALRPSPPVTHYREFARRQSGRYAVTSHLSDPQVAAVIQSCCAPQHCLKRRWWTVNGLAPDSTTDKGILPCLEPCAILLDQARKAAVESPR